MLEHYVEAYKATDEGRGWVGEEEKADGVAETLWSSDGLSVICFFYFAATQTNTDSYSHQTHNHTQRICACH